MKMSIIEACEKHNDVICVYEIQPDVLYSIEFDEFELNCCERNNLMIQLKTDEDEYGKYELKYPEFFWISEPLPMQDDYKKDVNLLFAISCITNNLSNKHLGKISFSLHEDYTFNFDYCFSLYGFSPDDEIDCQIISDIISDFRAAYETLNKVMNALESGDIEAAVDITFPKEEIYVDPLMIFALKAKASGVDIKFSNDKKSEYDLFMENFDEESETKFLGRFENLDDSDL